MSRIAAIFSRTNPISPLHYTSQQTALLLLDYHNLVTSQLTHHPPPPSTPSSSTGPNNYIAVAASMRAWAVSKGIPTLHCLVNVEAGCCPPQFKAAERMEGLKGMVRGNPWLGEEVEELKPVDGEEKKAAAVGAAAVTTGVGGVEQGKGEGKGQGAEQEKEKEKRKEHVFLRAPGLVSALKSSGLQDFLATENILSLILCGVSTSGCLFSTARAAADEGFVVTVIKDACADPVEGLHEMLCEHALTMQAHVCEGGEFRWRWGEE